MDSSAAGCETSHETTPLTAAAKEGSGYGARSEKLALRECGLPSKSGDIEEEAFLPTDAEGRYPCLDVVRVLCVFLACVDHGGTAFGAHNTMFVQSWVLQYLFYVCGFCYAMSSRPLGAYLSRLALYFCVGVSCNLLAWQLTGRDWRANPFGMVFQFWFVFGLMQFLIVLAPVKHYLATLQRERRGNPLRQMPELPGARGSLFTDVLHGLATMAGAYLAVKILFSLVLLPLTCELFAGPLSAMLSHLGKAGEFWGVPQTQGDHHEAASEFLGTLLGYCELSAGNLVILLVYPRSSSRLSLTLWVLLANTYLHKCLLYRAQEARMLNSFDCTTMGLAFYYLGLAGRRRIGEYFIRYWFLFLFVGSLLWPPEQTGRLDESPPTDLHTRFTFNFLELLFALLFFGGVERMVDPKIFAVDGLQFLGTWSLLIFLVHKFFVLVVGTPGYWLVLALMLLPCKWLQGASKASSKALKTDGEVAA